MDEADPIVTDLTARVGEASTVKVTVIGRPNHVVERQGIVVVAHAWSRHLHVPFAAIAAMRGMVIMVALPVQQAVVAIWP